MYTTSEWVSLGHPDKTADYIGSRILDEMIKQDPKTRCGLEVQFKGNVVNLAGEITTDAKVNFTDVVRKAVKEVGYDEKYAEIWGKENVPVCSDIVVNQYITKQSQDISVGVDNNGWGDQGIYFGMATPDPLFCYIPKDYYFAKKLGEHLYAFAKKETGLGLDIKTMVTMQGNTVSDVIVAIPIKKDSDSVRSHLNDKIFRFFKRFHIEPDKVIVNGTGEYVRHSSMADAGVLGRKLVVDAYGGNCPIGGGAYWGKDGTKSDLTLNLYARELAFAYAQTTNKTCYSRLSGVIGRNEVSLDVIDKYGVSIVSTLRTVSPRELIQRYELNTPVFADMVRCGLFSRIQ